MGWADGVYSTACAPKWEGLREERADQSSWTSIFRIFIPRSGSEKNRYAMAMARPMIPPTILALLFFPPVARLCALLDRWRLAK